MRLALALLFAALPLAALPLRAQEVVFLVRHAERADSSKDAALSAAGEARARALAGKLREAGVTAIYTSEFRRTKETAAPLARALGIAPREHAAADSAGLVALLRKEKRVLVVGHSNTLPEVAAGLGVKEKIEIADDRFDDLLVVVPPRLVRLKQ